MALTTKVWLFPMSDDYHEKRYDNKGNGHGSKGSYGKGRDGDRKGGYGGRGPRDSKKDYRPRDGDRKPYGDKKDYKPRDRDGGDRRSYGDRPRREDDRKPYGDRDKRDFKPRNDERREYKPRDRQDGDREYRPRDRDDRFRGNNRGPRRDGDREYKPRDRDDRGGRRYDDHGSRRDGDRDYRPRDRDDRRSYDRSRRNDDRGYRPRDRDDRGGRRYDDRKPREHNDERRGGFDRRGPRDDRRDYKPRYNDESSREQEESGPKIPNDPQKILFKGIDCEVKGKTDLAMTFYLHGAIKMSKGCENNALTMLRNMGAKEFLPMRERVAQKCPEDALVYYDFMCLSLVPSYDRTSFDAAFEAGNLMSIYCRIRLEEIEGEDPCIDTFAAAITNKEEMVESALKLLVRKKGSAKAKAYLEANEERKKLKNTIRPTFIKAMAGETSAVKRLEKLSEEFPEASLLREYITAYADDGHEQFLRENYSTFEDTILSIAPELGISDTAYGKYLMAKRLQKNEEEWIQSMIGALSAGSEEAMEELRPVQDRKDVRKSLTNIYLAKGNAPGLVRCYDGFDTTALDHYCSNNPEKIIEVGRLMGGLREIEWLKKGFRDGHEECKGALIEIAKDPERYGKPLVYALHDVGAELESAKMFFAMGDDPSLPSVKWLAKVCADEEAKEYVRSQFEAKGDLETFESIFIDDGYTKDPKKRGPKKGGFGKKGGFDRNRGEGRY